MLGLSVWMSPVLIMMTGHRCFSSSAELVTKLRRYSSREIELVPPPDTGLADGVDCARRFRQHGCAAGGETRGDGARMKHGG